MRILTLSTAWAGHSGGVTVNRELSIALADLGHDVTARVSVPSPSHPRVQVQGLEPVLGVTDERGQLLRADGLPRNVDVIVGHGRFTGGAASYLRDQFYPQAKVVHIVHALTDELDRLRDDPMQATEHANTERLLIGKADVAMGLGPLLTDDAARLARMSPTPPLVAEMPPGVILGEPPAPFALQNRLNLLLFGRADDPLKGANLAAQVAGRLHAEGIDLQLTVLGAQPSQLRVQERALSDIAQIPVKVKPFTPDRTLIEAEIRGADLVLMPSKHEGFGLVATEAAGFGVPVAVASNTGAGQFFNNARRIPGHLGQPSVVHAPPHSDEQQLVQLWAQHVKDRLNPEALPHTRARALELREFLGKNYTWNHSAEAMDVSVAQLAAAPARAAAYLRGETIKGQRTVDVRTPQALHRAGKFDPASPPGQPRWPAGPGGTTHEGPNPLALLSDADLAQYRADLTNAAQALTGQAVTTAATAQALADRYEQDGGETVAQLTATSAAPELIERARASAAEDVTSAREAARAIQNQISDVNSRIQRAAEETQRRTGLTQQQRQAEQVARLQHATQRQAQTPSTPQPVPKITDAGGPARGGASL
ncbi:glycosyltransferase family 4 protein [Streptomyces sp. NPDC001020]